MSLQQSVHEPKGALVTNQSPYLSDDLATREPRGGNDQLQGEEEDQHG